MIVAPPAGRELRSFRGERSIRGWESGETRIPYAAAFKLLRDEGVLESRRRSGVFVSQPRIKSTFILRRRQQRKSIRRNGRR